MRFNKPKVEDQRRHLAEKKANAHRATGRQIREDADHLVAVKVVDARRTALR
jgi:hypothetical protein